MARLRKLKFKDYDEMHDYYDNNEYEVHLYTLDKLEKSWKSDPKQKTVDIYDIEITDVDDDVEFLSIYEGEWEEAFLEMKNYFVRTQKYEIAARVRNFEKIVLNIKD
jgi:hypothetical protein